MKFVILFFLLFLTACGDQSSGEATVDGVPVGSHRVFVTSLEYSGNLGGLSGADEKCQLLATQAGLVKTYRALLSSSSENIKERILITDAIYVVDSESSYKKVAASQSDFWNTSNKDLLHSISYNENITEVIKTTWTGTTSSGTSNLNNCQNWTSNDSSGLGDVGDSSKTSTEWIDNNSDSCDTFYPLNCISQ